MAESKVNRSNYISVQGFMVRDLQLKGNELLVYAIIYGFSQAESQVFNGSLQYLADWTNSTKQGVIKCLKSLVEKGYIQKTEKIINGVKFCEYYATNLTTVLNKIEYPVEESLTGGMQHSLPNNIVSDNTSNIIVEKDKKIRHKYGEYNNVLLSDDDMEKLRTEFPLDYEERIERLSSYMASTGKSYKNHLATIRNWAKRDAKATKQGTFDTDDFFEAAVRKSFSCLDPSKPKPKTAGEDASIRERAEKLKRELG